MTGQKRAEPLRLSLTIAINSPTPECELAVIQSLGVLPNNDPFSIKPATRTSAYGVDRCRLLVRRAAR